MSKTERVVPYHLRQRAQEVQDKVDAVRKANLDRLKRPSEPAPPPNVEVQNSSLVVQPRQPVQQPEQSIEQPAAVNWPDPSAGVRLDANELNDVLNEVIDEPAASKPVDYEHLYKTEMGRASKEATERNRIEREYQELRRRTAELESRIENERISKVDDSILPSYFSADEIATRGVESCRNEIIRLRRLAAEQTSSVRDEVKRTKEEATRNTADARRLALFQLLDNNSEIPNWRTVDKDPAFLGWVTQSEPITGRTYAELLHEGAANADLSVASRACAEIYKRYIATTKRPAAPRQPTGRVLPNGRPPAAPPQQSAPDMMTPEKMQGLLSEFKRTRDPERRLEIQKTLREAQAKNLIVSSR